MGLCAMDHLRRHNLPPRFAVGGVLYRSKANSRFEIVLIKKQGGGWTLPKGQLEGAETMAEGLAREMMEEVALTGVIEKQLLTLSYSIVKRNRLCVKMVRYYLVRVTDG